jgi:multisubunit Na+/H+ antiporter MnhC subunit
MNEDIGTIMKLFSLFIVMVFACGLYYMIVTRNFIKVLIGMELLTKAVTLMIIIVGYVTKNMALAQALVINLIVVEVVVIAVAAGIVLSIHRHTDNLDVRELRNLKG